MFFYFLMVHNLVLLYFFTTFKIRFYNENYYLQYYKYAVKNNDALKIEVNWSKI